MNNIISVKNLIKRYNKADKNAVDDISFEVSEGEFFTFLGPNGAGKTTTISILITTLSKTSGDVKIAGFDSDLESSKIRQNVGIIFQKPSLDANLTAEENIRFHAILYGLYSFKPFFSLMPNDYQKRAHLLANIVGIKNDLHKPIKTFSGGMKRKLEIVRSLIHEPKILFLDEPTIGLDPHSRKSLWQYLHQVKKEQNTTIFLTTHYLDEAEDADRVCIINNGKIVALDTPEKIKKDLTKEYLIINSKNRDSLKKELAKLKLKFSEDKDFKVELGNKKSQEVIKSIKSELTELKIHSPSLEDAYLEIVGAREEDK